MQGAVVQGVERISSLPGSSPRHGWLALPRPIYQCFWPKASTPLHVCCFRVASEAQTAYCWGVGDCPVLVLVLVVRRGMGQLGKRYCCVAGKGWCWLEQVLWFQNHRSGLCCCAVEGAIRPTTACVSLPLLAGFHVEATRPPRPRVGYYEGLLRTRIWALAWVDVKAVEGDVGQVNDDVWTCQGYGCIRKGESPRPRYRRRCCLHM